MNATENEHEWFSHQLATYLAGGLSDPRERARFAAHAAACESCGAELKAAQQLEGKMSELFAVGIPDSDFEHRIATRLKFRLDRRQRVNPKVRKAAIAAAAVIMFGGWGYVAQKSMENGSLPSLAFFDAKPTAKSPGITPRLGQGAVLDGNLDRGSSTHSLNIANIASLTSGGTADMTTDATGTLTKTGNGEILLTGAGNALTSGVVTISGGTLRLNHFGAAAGSVSTRSITFDGYGPNSAPMVVDTGTPAVNKTLNMGSFAGRATGTTGALTITPRTGGLNTNEVITAENFGKPVGPASNHGILAPYVAAQASATNSSVDFLTSSGNHIVGGAAAYADGSVNPLFRSAFSLKDLGNGVVAAHVDVSSGAPREMKWVGTQGGNWDLNFTKNFQAAGAGTNFFQNESVTFDDSTGKRAVRVQPGGTFRLGTPANTPQNAGSIITAATGLLRTADSGGVIDVRNAADADGDGISDQARLETFKTAPGVTWAGNGGQIAGNIRSGATPSQNGTSNSSSPNYFYNGETVRFSDSGGGAVVLNGTNTYTGGTTVSLGSVRPGHTQTELASKPGALSGLGIVSTAGDGQMEVTTPPAAAPSPVVLGLGSTIVPDAGRFPAQTTTSNGTLVPRGTPGQVVISDANTFTGNTTISSNGPTPQKKLPSDKLTVVAGTLDFVASGQVSSGSGDSALPKVGTGAVALTGTNSFGSGTAKGEPPVDAKRAVAGPSWTYNAGGAVPWTRSWDVNTNWNANSGSPSGGASNTPAQRALSSRGSNTYGLNGTGSLTIVAGTHEIEARAEQSAAGTSGYVNGAHNHNAGTMTPGGFASGGTVNGAAGDKSITVAGGNVALRADGPMNLGGAKVNVGNGNVVLSLDGNKQLSNFITSSGTGNLVVDSPSSVVTFANGSSNLQRLTVQSGAVQLSGNNQLPKGGTGTLATDRTPAVNVGSGSSTYAGTMTNGNNSSGGTVHFYTAADPSVVKSGPGWLDLDGSASRGSIENTGGGTNNLVVNGDIAFDPKMSAAGGKSITLAGGNLALRQDPNTFGNNGAATLNVTQGSVPMTSRSAGDQRFGIPSQTVNIGSGSSTYAEITTNGTGIALSKDGTGTQIFTGANSYAGGTRLNTGTLTVTGSGAFDMNGRTQALNTGNGAGTNDLVVMNGDMALNGGKLSGDRLAGGWGTIALNATPVTIGKLVIQPGDSNAGNTGTTLVSSGKPPVNNLAMNGPVALPGLSTVETQSELRPFKPADALALNQPAKPQTGLKIQSTAGDGQLDWQGAAGGTWDVKSNWNPNTVYANSTAKPQAGADAGQPISIGDISSKPSDGAKARLQSLQSDGQIRSSTYTPVDTLQSSAPAQVANGVGAGDRTPAAGQLNQVYGGTDPSQTTRNQSQGSLATRDQIAQAVSQPVGGPAGDANSGRAVATQAQANAAAARRVIREGTMEFEVDSFDSTFNQIATIVGEEGGFIAAADSDKLPNGKVRGMVTVRVPPDRLDLLVLKLRALGELKSQKLGSRDVGKEYTDVESELRAARAMEARLLEMIAKAQGKVAELLEAEKELANWRTKIEKMTGTLNYYNNLISMATLNLQLYEKDIRTPASANITEEISTGVETEDVESARNAALKAIDEAKGRIIESNLQKLEAGQFAAKIVAEVAPENAGPIIDRLKQLGRLARYDVQKKQTNEGAKNANGAQSQAPVRLETIPTRIVISLYNLANVAPRLTNNLNIAGDDVEAVYRAILKRVNDAGGRVVSSNLNRQDRAQVTGTMQFEIKAADADAVLNDVRLQGIVLRMVVNENPDTANVTTAKQAFVLSIIPTAQLSAKHFANINLAAEDVEAAYGAILKRINASAGSRVISSNLNRQDASQINGTIQFELKSEDADAVVNDLRLQGLVLRMNVGENADGMNVTTVKRSYTLQVVPMATLSPKLTTNLNLAAADVEGMYNSILKIVSSSAGSRVVSSNLSRQDATQAVGSLQFEVKSDEAPAVLNEIRKNVQVLQLNLLENPDNATVTTAKQAFVVQIIPTSQVQPREVRNLGIQTSEVESAVQILTAAVANVGGRMIDSSLSQDKNGTTVARLAIEVPLDKTEQIADMIRKQGTVRSAESTKNTQIPDGPLSRARLNVTLATGETIVPSEGGFGASIREGLSTSVKGLLWSLQLIVIGVCLVAPWLLLMWGGWRILKKRKRTTPGV